MANIITRQTTGTNATAKNAPLSNAEMDNNLINMNSEVSTLVLNANKYAGELSFLYLEMIKAMPGLKGYWPADPAYIYQDSAGTIPASVGGVVGLILDIVRSGQVGADIVTNGTFDTNTTGWLKQAAATIASVSGGIDGNCLELTNGAAYGFAYQVVTTTPGKMYSFSAYAKKGTATAFILSAGTNAGWNDLGTTGNLSNSEWTLITLKFIAGSATTYISLYNGSNTPGETSYFDSVSVVEMLGNHAYQTTTANKPYLRKTPTSNVHWLDSNTSTSALTATLGDLGAACTVCQAGAEGVTFTEGATISSTYNIAPALGFNGDVAIFDRALTTTEKALLTRYMQRGVPLLGANLITNGTFDTDTTGWVPRITYGVGATSVTGGVVSVTGNGVDTLGALAQVPVATGTIGTQWAVSARLRAVSGGGSFIRCTRASHSNQNPLVNNYTTAFQTINYAYLQTVETGTGVLIGPGVSTGVAAFDDISLRQIL